MMVSDHYIDAAGISVIDRLIGCDARVAGHKQFHAAVDDWLESLDMHPVTFLAADWDVINNIRFQGLERLHQHGRGGLPIYIEIAPDTDQLLVPDRGLDALHGGFDVRERCRWNRIRVEERPSGLRRVDAAPDESLRDQRRQAEVRERGGNFHRRGIDPASHVNFIISG
jgi:hypothetical protein